MKLLPTILRRVADPVEPFDFKFLQNVLPPPLLDGIGDSLRKQPGLFSQLEGGQVNELQNIHYAFLTPFGRRSCLR